MTTGIRCQADPRCQIPAPSETGICHDHAKQTTNTDPTIRTFSLINQVWGALSREPEKELEP